MKLEDLKQGNLTSSWKLDVPHEPVSPEDAKYMLEQVTMSMLLSIARGAWEGSDELNQTFPEFLFMGIEEFLAGV